MKKLSPTLSQMPGMIRRAEADDAPAIENLYRELVSDPLIRVLPEQIASLSESSTSFLLIAELEDVPCGTILLSVCPDVMYRTQPFGVIENAIVTQSSRGKGIGRHMFSHVEHLAFTHHCTKLLLLSSAARERSHSFFRHCGFTSDTKYAFVKYRRQFEPNGEATQTRDAPLEE